MSTTPPPATAAVYRDSQRIALDDLFDTLVFYSDEWCSGCFERIRQVDEIDTDTWGSGNQPGQVRQRVGAGCLGYDFETHDDYGTITVRDDDGQVTGVEPRGTYGLRRTYTTRTFCDSCGANNGHAPELTIGKREAVRRADQLVDCLLAQGVAIHRKAAKRFVAKAKERPDIADRDHDIFEQAVVHARRVAVRES